MPEKTKSVAEIKQMEATLNENKEATKKATLATVEGLVVELWELGFEYELKPVEGQETPKNGHSCSVCKSSGHSKRTCPTLLPPKAGVIASMFTGRKENQVG